MSLSSAAGGKLTACSTVQLLLMDESIGSYPKRIQTRFQRPGHSFDGSPNRFLTGFACQLRVWNPHAGAMLAPAAPFGDGMGSGTRTHGTIGQSEPNMRLPCGPIPIPCK